MEEADASSARAAQGIEDTIKRIKNKFGDDSIMKLGEKPRVDINAIPTGSIGLDWAPVSAACLADVSWRFWTRVFWKDHPHASCYCRGTKVRRHLRLHRCGTCDASTVRSATRREDRSTPHLPADTGEQG